MIYISEAFVSDKFGFNESVSDSGQKMLVLEGEFQRASKPNKNGRVYKEELLFRETNKLARFINERGGHPMGMDHPVPKDANDQRAAMELQKITMENGCGITTHLEMHNDVVYGKAKVLVGDYSTGDKLAAYIRAGYKPGVSSRGLGGDPRSDGKYLYVPEDYNMICYDFVTNPSTHNAILHKSINEEYGKFVEHKNKLFSVLIDIYKLENK